MATEIERKFLVRSDAWRKSVERCQAMRQGYLSEGGAATVRVRIAGDEARLTIKSAVAGAVRSEYEYPIPFADARRILDELCRARIEKTRHWARAGVHLWEVDVFEGDNTGLVVAEVELERDDETVDLPDWVGNEVTDQRRYYNAELARHPYKDW